MGTNFSRYYRHPKGKKNKEREKRSVALLKRSVNNEQEILSPALSHWNSMNNSQKSIEMLSCLLGAPSRTSTAELEAPLLDAKDSRAFLKTSVLLGSMCRLRGLSALALEHVTSCQGLGSPLTDLETTLLPDPLQTKPHRN